MVRRDVEGVLWVAGVALRPKDASAGGLGDWLLEQRQVLVRGATITWLDEMRGAPELRLDKVNLRLDRDGTMHRVGLTAVPPAQIASPFAVRAEFRGSDLGDAQSWSGRLYAQIGYADLALVQKWIPSPLQIGSGLGSMRLWLQRDGTRLNAATADVGLVNVHARLAPDLPELALSEVHGRLSWSQSGDRSEFSATSLGFTVAGGVDVLCDAEICQHAYSLGWWHCISFFFQHRRIVAQAV